MGVLGPIGSMTLPELKGDHPRIFLNSIFFFNHRNICRSLSGDTYYQNLYSCSSIQRRSDCCSLCEQNQSIHIFRISCKCLHINTSVSISRIFTFFKHFPVVFVHKIILLFEETLVVRCKSLNVL